MSAVITSVDTPVGAADVQPPLDLPEEIAYHGLEERIRDLCRPALSFSSPRHDRRKGAKATGFSIAAPGSTRTWGEPDIPIGWPDLSERMWSQSPYDGESWWLQLNLEEIPQDVRCTPSMAALPAVGVVWVFIDLSDGWTARVEFDPRPAAQIPWQPRRTEVTSPEAATWTRLSTLPCATPATLPEIATWPEAADAYDNWAWAQCRGRLITERPQIGGWCWPIQGLNDDRQATFICAMEHQSFGDSGAVYLHYAPERGFFAFVETC